eukprot:TRINITY_DN2347_c0_g1_i2.p1 TRINITY_DN2347_c0_g1~~TRINITY_DN2347_c0_g1_i2.p1  ORF type:complete len:316 (+),score=63.14 TRINITY_DN2347_c0_g1_i2:123-1070(+)
MDRFRWVFPIFLVLSGLLFVAQESASQCQSEQFSLAFNGVEAFSVSKPNSTCIWPAGISTSSLNVTGALTALSANVSGALVSSGAVSAASAAVSASVTAVNVTVGGAVTASSFVGDASRLTNLVGQAEFAAVRSKLNMLDAANTQKACPAGAAVRQINSDGTFACLQIGNNGALNSKCVSTADCNSPLLCDKKTSRCAGTAGYACTSDAQCQTGLACTLNGQCSIPPTSCTAIKAAYPPAASGVYLLSVPRKGAVYFYCNMVSAGSFGWTLAWSNVRGGTGKPATQMTLEPAINVRPTCSWFSIAQHSPVRTIKT